MLDRRSIAVAGLVLLCTSCIDPPADDRVSRTSSAVIAVAPLVTFTMTITTPRLVSPLTVTLGSTGPMQIGASTKIVRPGTGVTVVTSVGAGGVSAEPQAQLGDIWSTSPVTLRDRVRVLGTIHAPAVVQGNAVSVAGGIDTSTPITPVTVIAWTVVYPAAIPTDVALGNGQTASRPPGRFGTMRVFSGGTLTLTTGSYYLDALVLEPGAKVVLSQDTGPVIVYVRQSAILRGSVVSSVNGSPPDFLLGYLGTSELFVEMPFSGTVVAPSAKLTLRSVPSGHTGSFFGRTIEVGPNTTITFRPGHALLVPGLPRDPEACTASIQPSDSLTGRAREIQYQTDIVRFCTAGGTSTCEQTLRARINVDFFTAAASLFSDRMSTGVYVALLRERDAKMATFRDDPGLACRVVAGDGDGDFVPNGVDLCPNTPPLTPVLGDGCTNSQIPPGPDINQVKDVVRYIGVTADPRCTGAPFPTVPAPLGAFRWIDPSFGKSVWISRDPDTSGCPLFYQIEFYLTDNSGLRTATFSAGEDTELPWISRPRGAVQFNIRASDPGDRAAWSSYAVFTRTFRARAFNQAGQRSAWSEFFTHGHEDCVAGQPCADL